MDLLLAQLRLAWQSDPGVPRPSPARAAPPLPPSLRAHFLPKMLPSLQSL